MEIEQGIETANTLLQLAPAILNLIGLLASIFRAPKSGPIRKAALMATVAHLPEPVQAGVSRMTDDTIAAQNAAAARVPATLKGSFATPAAAIAAAVAIDSGA